MMCTDDEVFQRAYNREYDYTLARYAHRPLFVVRAALNRAMSTKPLQDSLGENRDQAREAALRQVLSDRLSDDKGE